VLPARAISSTACHFQHRARERARRRGSREGERREEEEEEVDHRYLVPFLDY